MKRRRKRRKARHKPIDRSGKKHDEFQLVEYEITEDPIPDRRYDRLSERVKDEIEQLHFDAQTRPQEAIPKLENLIEKYPNIPMLYNYLSVAYSGAGQPERSKETVRKNYQQNPKYLFARLNYAEICLKERDFEQIEEIFEHKYDLKMLYPRRKRFHISEVVNFMGFMGVFMLEKGERELAETYLSILEEIGPDYPMTMRLRRWLHPGFIGRMVNKLRAQNQTDS